MGNSESADPGGGGIDDFDGVETLGYRVLGVQPNSPASAAGLVSFFDFLIGADEKMLLGSGEELQEGEEYDDLDFPDLLEKFKGKTLQLLVWNIKCQEKRLVDIVPSDDWEGAGLLGVTIRLDNYAGAEDRLIRILSVEHNSPAAIAGLVSEQDYLLGTTTHSFDSTKVLAAVLEAHVDRVVELYVYNTNSDKVRVVALMPTFSWGGNGLLGAEVGTGYLHRLPASCRSTLGGSVERRVRWVGGSKNGPTSPQLQQAAALELEPQLEMEPNHEEDEDDGGDEHSLGTVSLASHMSATPDAKGAHTRTGDNDPAQEDKTQANPPTDTSDAQASTEARTPEEAVQAVHPIPVEQNSEPAQPVAQQMPAPLQPPILHTNESSSSYQTTYHSTTPTGQPVSAPAPYPMPMPDPLANPATITTFIPAAKPPEGQNVSAKDLFAGPPPVAKIPSKANLVISSPPQTSRKAPSSTGSGASVNSRKDDGEPPFSTPHPPSAVRPSSETAGGSPPPPPVGGEAAGAGVSDMPPPPTMSGAH